MKISKTFLLWGLILKKLLSPLTPNIWEPCTLMFVFSNDTSTSLLSKPSLVYNFQITVVKQPIQQFRQLLACPAVFLISLERTISHVWFHAVLIKILTSEWQETFAVRSRLQSQLDSITNFSHLSKDTVVRCLGLALIQESLWQIQQKRLKAR